MTQRRINGFDSNGGIYEFLSNFYCWSFALTSDAAAHPDSLLAEPSGRTLMELRAEVALPQPNRA
ncbi:hypothetical protein [Paenarthrobacter nitroguajacolicus]|uniref:hypothetical protein n=1 Tax=Paenarthrobacter nitroguajacolicus TaxID=211146 RepID=UPI0015BFFDC9|nr:hypothetical protein [Paenarthrobacter nitroguajacolicus]